MNCDLINNKNSTFIKLGTCIFSELSLAVACVLIKRHYVKYLSAQSYRYFGSLPPTVLYLGMQDTVDCTYRSTVG
jgi:hypothetical protein